VPLSVVKRLGEMMLLQERITSGETRPGIRAVGRHVVSRALSEGRPVKLNLFAGDAL